MSDIIREHLLQSLNLAKAAVAGQAYVPALTHFAFDGWGIMAYNDVSAIGVRGPVDLPICLPADMLIKTLNSMTAEKILMTQTNDGAVVVASGRSKVKLPYLELDAFPFEFPKVDWDAGFTVTADMLKGIEKCLVGVGTDPTHPAQMGVTLEATDSGCLMYSTDNFTISRYKSDAKIQLPGDVPIIMPAFFCNQLLALSKAFIDEDIIIGLPAGAICATFGGQAMLFTKLLVDLEPMDFSRIMGKYLQGVSADGAVDIPNGFESALDRALLILSTEMDKATKISVENGKMNLFSSSGQGESSDSLTFDYEDTATFLADPALVSRASKICRKVALIDKVMLLADGPFTHLVAHCSV